QRLPAVDEPYHGRPAVEFITDRPVAGNDAAGFELKLANKMARGGLPCLTALIRGNCRASLPGRAAEGGLGLLDADVDHMPPRRREYRCRPGRGSFDPGNLHK